MSQHKAAVIPAKGEQLEIQSVPTPSPTADEVLIRVKAIAINPVDHMIQDTGILVRSWPMVVGSDIAGEVVEVGSGVSNASLKEGARVLANATYLMSGKKEAAGYQELILVPEIAVASIPDSMSFEEASVLPLSVSTVASGMYVKKHLGLDLPTLDPKPSGKKLLIWGGSGSVGSSAVQLAAASGYDAVVTTSPKNFDYVKSLAKGFNGQIKVFDYKSPSIVGDLVEELSDACVGAYDAIGTEEVELQIATVLAQLGGGTIASVLQPPEGLPASVNSEWVFATTIFDTAREVGKAVYEDFLPRALAEGKFIPAPKPEVVGQGLNSLQEAMIKQKNGVSAKKLVVTL